MNSFPLPIDHKRFEPLRLVSLAFTLSIFFVNGHTAFAQDAFKLALGNYQTSGGGASTSRALDLNLRHSSNAGNIWLGAYQQPHGQGDGANLRQLRLGWDNSFALGSWQLQPSLQTAQGGFWGGSVGLESGEDIHKNVYGGVGLGRTNLRPYVNLNFDPNDALMLWAGFRRDGGRESYALQWVGDNRLNPDQRHLHAIYRNKGSENDRITVDLLHKAGLVDGEPIRQWGLAVAYDHKQWFGKIAYDPKVNFTAQNMWRVSAGLRF